VWLIATTHGKGPGRTDFAAPNLRSNIDKKFRVNWMDERASTNPHESWRGTYL